MSQTLTLRARGLHSSGSAIAAPADGHLLQAKNVEVKRVGIWQPRRGLDTLGSNLSIGVPDYVGQYLSQLIVHAAGGQLVSVDPGTGTPTSLGIVAAPAPMRTIEASGNLYLLANNGVKRMESTTMVPVAAGVPGGLDIQSAIQLTDGTAIPGQATSGSLGGCQVAYRILFGKRDLNQNLHLGAPSGRGIVTSSSFIATVGLMSRTGTTVTVTYAGHGLSVGENIVVTPGDSVIAGGIYTVATVPDTSHFTFATSAGTANTAAETVARTFTAPIGTMTRAGSTVTVVATHGFAVGSSGQSFTIAAPGDTTIPAGTYTVASVTDATHFTFTSAGPAGSNTAAATITYSILVPIGGTFTAGIGTMTRAGSTVTVSGPVHGFAVGSSGQAFTVSPGDATIAGGVYTVASVTDSTHFTFSSSGTAGSNTVADTVTYGMILSGTTVTVTFINHYLSVGNNFTISPGDAVIAPTISPGTYTVATVADANHFTFTVTATVNTVPSTITRTDRNAAVSATIPPGVSDGTYFYQVYRSPASVTALTSPSDEMNLVFESPVPLIQQITTLARAANVVTAVTQAAHGYQTGEVVYLPLGYGSAGTFVAVGTNVAATSPDGVTWTARTIPAGSYKALVWTGTQLVAVGLGCCATSPDGVTWTAQAGIGGNSYYAVAWTGSLVVAVGPFGVCTTSPDGVTWTARTMPNGYWYGLAWNGSYLVAIGISGGTYMVARSSDGVTWTGISAGATAGRAILWDGTKWVVVGYNSLFTSYDGNNWTNYSSGMPTGLWSTIAFNGTDYVIGKNSPGAAHSTTGISFSAVTTPTTDNEGVAWNGSTFAMVGTPTQATTSTNGLSWAAQTMPAGIFVAVTAFGGVSVPAGYYTIVSTPTGNSFTFASVGTTFTTAAAAQAVTPITAGVVDVVPDTLVGQPLYTNQNQEGFSQSNDPPPDCLDIAKFRQTTFFAAVLRPPSVQVQLLSVDTTIGLQIGDTITVSGGTLTAAAAENPAAKQFKVYTDSASPSVNIANTTQSIIRTINRASGLGCIAVSTASQDSLPGSFAVVSTSVTAAAVFIPNAHTSAWSPSQGQTQQPQRDLNLLGYSKLDQPDAAPVLNTYRVGVSGKKILRLFPLRDALFIVKEDGVYRLTGTSPADFVIQPLDLTLQFPAVNAMAPLANTLIVLTNRGFAQITDTGVTVLSFQDLEDLVQGLLTPAMLPVLASTALAVSYESERTIIFWLPAVSTDTAPTQAVVYNLATNSFTTRDDMYTAGTVRTIDNRLYMADSAGQLWKERKNLDYTDFVQQTVGTAYTITAISQSTVLFFASVSAFQVGDVLSQPTSSSWANITAIDTVNNAVTVDRQQNWTAGTANVTVYRHIDCILEWLPHFGEDPGINQHWREVALLFREMAFADMSVSFATNVSPIEDYVDVLASALNVYRGDTTSKTIRVGVPREKQRGNQLRIVVRHHDGWQPFTLQGLSVIYETMSERVSR